AALAWASPNDAPQAVADQSGLLIAKLPRHFLEDPALILRQAGNAMLRDLVQDAVDFRGVFLGRLLFRDVLQRLALVQHYRVAPRHDFIDASASVTHRSAVAWYGAR